MTVTKRKINPNLSDEDNAKLLALMKYEPEDDYIEAKICRRSVLDDHLPEILKKKGDGWGLQRIANYLTAKYGTKNVNKSTVSKRIKKFYKKG